MNEPKKNVNAKTLKKEEVENKLQDTYVKKLDTLQKVEKNHLNEQKKVTNVYLFHLSHSELEDQYCKVLVNSIKEWCQKEQNLDKRGIILDTSAGYKIFENLKESDSIKN